MGIRKTLALYAAVLAAMFHAGCTVLEDRSSCPNWLVLDMQDVDSEIKEWQIWLFSSGGEFLYKDTIYRRSYSSPVTLEVPRRKSVCCYMWGNVRGASRLNEKYSTASTVEKLKGVSSDSLYFFSDTLSTDREDSYIKVCPVKEFATVDIYLKGWTGNDFIADVELECASSGFYVNREFVQKESVIYPQMGDLGNYYTHFSCRMLRQQDNENIVLRLKLRDVENDGSAGSIILEKEIPLGEYLQSNGYNMQALNMQDVQMEVDYSYNRLLIRADEWEAEYKIVEEI